MVERERAYQAQLQAERDRAKQLEEYVWNQTLSQVPENARPLYEWARQNNQYVQALQKENEDRKRYTQQMEQAVLPMVKDKVYTHLSQSSKVPKEVLALAETPADADKIIKAIAIMEQRKAFQARQANGNDTVPNSSGQAFPSAQNPELAKFKNTGDLKGYILAKKRAGLW